MNNSSTTNTFKITRMRVILFAIVFLFFALIGFVLIQQILGIFVHKAPAVTPTATAPVFMNQSNLLFIHADRVNNPTPRLVSIWAVIISKNEPPHVIAKALYPDPTSAENNRKFEQSFAYSEDKGLSPEFIKAAKSFNWAWNAYMIVDDEGITRLIEWLNPNQSLPEVAGETAGPRAVLESEKGLLQNICGNLGKTEKERGPSPHWKELIPNHMQTDLFFKDAAVNWDHITLSTATPDCKILLNP